jgi:hypothetical protein
MAIHCPGVRWEVWVEHPGQQPDRAAADARSMSMWLRQTSEGDAARALATLDDRSLPGVQERMMAAGTVTADGRARVLADGNEIPLLGLGVWQVPNGRECEDAVRWALEAGYRHVDTAQAYGNERSVGRALRDSGLPREDVFITTKFYPGRRDPEAEVQRSLERLGVDSVDLYIIHWPQGGPTWAWDGMQRAHGRGYARSIGVSNFGASDLDAVLEVADVAPVINQVQFSPFAFRRGLLAACDRHGWRLRPTARSAPAAISATGGWAASPSAWDARQPRS